MLPETPVSPNPTDNSLDSWRSPQDSNYRKLDLGWLVLVIAGGHHRRPASVVGKVHRPKNQWLTGLKIRQPPPHSSLECPSAGQPVSLVKGR